MVSPFMKASSDTMSQPQDVEARGLLAGQYHICSCFALTLLMFFVSQFLIRVCSAQDQIPRTKIEFMKRVLTLIVRFH